MIDDLFEINYNSIMVDEQLIDDKLTGGKKISYNLLNHKKYFDKMKQLNFFDFIKQYKEY